MGCTLGHAGSREASWQKEASAPGMQTAIFSPTSGIRRLDGGEDSLLIVVNRSHRPQSILEADIDFEKGSVLAGEPLNHTRVLSLIGYSLLRFHRGRS